MANRFRQSMPPSIDDVYRGLPFGPGGIAPFIHRAPSPPAAPLWRPIARALGSRIDRLIRAIGASGRHRSPPCQRPPLAPGYDRI